MRTSRRTTVVASLVGLAATALVSVAVPAQAYTNPLACDSNGVYADCWLGWGATNQRWYFNSVYYPAGDNQSEVYVHCQRNTQVGVIVYYTGGDGYGAAANSVYCALVQQ